MANGAVTVWEALQLEGTQVAGGIVYIDPDTLQPTIDVDNFKYDYDNKELSISKIATEVEVAAGTGNVTINKSAGQVKIAAAAQSLTLTNDRIEADSLIICTVATDDATAFAAKGIVIAAGSATIKLNAAATAETRVNFWVLRKK